MTGCLGDSYHRCCNPKLLLGARAAAMTAVTTWPCPCFFCLQMLFAVEWETTCIILYQKESGACEELIYIRRLSAACGSI